MSRDRQGYAGIGTDRLRKELGIRAMGNNIIELHNIIEIKDIRKQYGKGEAAVYALDGVDFSLEEGKVCVILGPSGSGKSTLLNMIGGLDSPDSGEITVDGRTITGMSKKELTKYRKQSIGFVFQFYNLIPDLTVEENVQVVAEIADSPIDIDEILEALEIDKYRYRFPRELSGGQQQRVAIARAMIKNPKLLLCDELTGALDTKSSRKVLRFVEKLNKEYGTTTLIITHNEAIAGIADVEMRIRDGKISKIRNNEDKLSADEIEL